MDIHFIIALLLATIGVGALATLAWGNASIPNLRDVPPAPVAEEAPSVSIVVAARDEERHLAAAVESLLAQRYPDFELVVVDDRSTDRTPGILADLAARDPRLTVVRVDELPAGGGWLGKNNALHQGAARARGELLLFTDADVVLEPDALARAVRLLRAANADHLAVAPEMVSPTWPLAMVVTYFMIWFLLWLRPWDAANPRSRRFIGIGAFNLVRAAAYRAVEGHTRIALRPDDDLMLGKLLKGGGYRQLLADGRDGARVEWYRTLPEMTRGLRKNVFAAMRYSLWMTVGAIAGVLTLTVWPFVAVFLTEGILRAVYAACAVAQLAAYAGPLVVQRSRRWMVVLYPVAALVFTWIVAQAVARAVIHGGIEWRGTFYPLEALRNNRV